MTNEQIFILYNNLVKMRNEGERLYPVKVSFAIVRNIKKLELIVNNYIKNRTVILNSKGTVNPENSNEYIVAPEKREEAIQELQELSNLEINVDFIKVSIQDFNNMQLTIVEAESLEAMVEEES